MQAVNLIAISNKVLPKESLLKMLQSVLPVDLHATATDVVLYSLRFVPSIFISVNETLNTAEQED